MGGASTSSDDIALDPRGPRGPRGGGGGSSCAGNPSCIGGSFCIGGSVCGGEAGNTCAFGNLLPTICLSSTLTLLPGRLLRSASSATWLVLADRWCRDDAVAVACSNETRRSTSFEMRRDSLVVWRQVQRSNMRLILAPWPLVFLVSRSALAVSRAALAAARFFRRACLFCSAAASSNFLRVRERCRPCWISSFFIAPVMHAGRQPRRVARMSSAGSAKLVSKRSRAQTNRGGGKGVRRATRGGRGAEGRKGRVVKRGGRGWGRRG